MVAEDAHKYGLPLRLYKDAREYAVDAWQRSILFADILRKRGNMYLEHENAGHPPVLVFDHEMILDGRLMPRAVNYAIVKILDRARTGETPRKETADPKTAAAGKSGSPRPGKRPIVVIDPRAGHGPGIGGSKLDSQIGIALKAGHPVYFITFFPDPEPGQTLADVQAAEVEFLEEVARRHPDADRPAVIGNCQAGWAAALIGADRPDVTGPLVFNGSPLSYWGGVEGANPMRYKGGLCGGVWMASLWSDLGNGKFDGANLVAGFEDLNPANTFWTKQYNLWAKVDTEEARYLNFEKWWGGFFKMNAEEIHTIVDSLFVGNELEQGRMSLGNGKVINLKNLKDPIVVFASKGDNITPPQQALNWIVKVYGSVDEIKRSGQTIVYIVHEDIGHLGIFVSSRVARREHAEIIGSVEMIDYLAPGLYEMVIEDASESPESAPRVKFVERDMSDILALDDGLEDEEAFLAVSALSRFNDKIYREIFSPWVRQMISDPAAEAIRQLHPLRMQRYLLSDLNPFLPPVKQLAPEVTAARQPVSPDNLFLEGEKALSESANILLNCYRDVRDSTQELMFNLLYQNPWMETLFPKPAPPSEVAEDPRMKKRREQVEKSLWKQVMERGGFVEGIVRIIVAMMGANKVFDRRQFEVAEKIVRVNERLRHVKPADFKVMIKEQAGMLQKDMKMALGALPKLLRAKNDRIEAFEIANSIAVADLDLDAAEENALGKIKTALKL